MSKFCWCSHTFTHLLKFLKTFLPPDQFSVVKGLINGPCLVGNMALPILTMTQQKSHSMSKVSRMPTLINKRMLLNLGLALVHPRLWPYWEEKPQKQQHWHKKSLLGSDVSGKKALRVSVCSFHLGNCPLCLSFPKGWKAKEREGRPRPVLSSFGAHLTSQVACEDLTISLRRCTPNFVFPKG